MTSSGPRTSRGGSRLRRRTLLSRAPTTIRTVTSWWEEMERRIVIISERAYSTTVNGIERIESHCIPGIGIVKVFFKQDTDLGD